jgi:hypothetical protein
MDISIHDNVLVSYEVLADKREILLRTRFPSTKSERTDIIFRGVEGYYFHHDNFETIIFDVVEISVVRILEDDGDRFDEGWRFAWPGRWNTESEADRRAYLAERGVKGFELSSSYGMSGWILAKSVERILKDERAA